MKAFKPLGFVLVCTITIYILATLGSQAVLTKADERNYRMYERGDGYYLPLREGLPWELFVIYKDALRLLPEKNIILFGASTTALGVLPGMVDLPRPWQVSNLSIAADNADGFRILTNYLDHHAPHGPGKKDIVCVNIEQASFVERKPEESPMRRYLEIFGFYSVFDDLYVTGSAPVVKREWALMNFRIRLALSELVMTMNTRFGPNLETVQGIKRAIVNRFKKDEEKRRAILNAPDRAGRFRDFWMGYMGGTTIPNDVTMRFEEFIIDLNSRTNVVVVNLFGGPWTRDYQAGRDYDAWVQGDLKKLLDDHEIPFFDYSQSLPASEFLDASHLSRSGREHFTRLFMADLKPLMERVNGTDYRRQSAPLGGQGR